MTSLVPFDIHQLSVEEDGQLTTRPGTLHRRFGLCGTPVLSKRFVWKPEFSVAQVMILTEGTSIAMWGVGEGILLLA